MAKKFSLEVITSDDLRDGRRVRVWSKLPSSATDEDIEDEHDRVLTLIDTLSSEFSLPWARAIIQDGRVTQVQILDGLDDGLVLYK